MSVLVKHKKIKGQKLSWHVNVQQREMLLKYLNWIFELSFQMKTSLLLNMTSSLRVIVIFSSKKATDSRLLKSE